MPGKSKHGKGRRNQFRNKPRPQQATPATGTAVQNNMTTTAASAEKAPAMKPVVKTAVPAKVQGTKASALLELPHIGKELQKIAIITGAIVVILIVLTFILK